MTSRRASVLLAGTLGLSALAGGAVLVPALASAATGEQSPTAAVGDRVDRIKDALQGLVDDGTITEAQRDKVATTLSEKLPPPGRGHRMKGLHAALDVAATTLGLSEQDLRAELRAGKSLADVAEEKGVPLATLKSALQKAAEDHLAEEVAEGDLTQAQADERKKDLSARLDDLLQRKGLPGPGRGHGRGHGPGAPGAPDDPPPPAEGSDEPSSYVPA